ncbi:MAG: hypothetical protein AVDCRST_MAG59-656, partial [uncultured Thermomicrobiales bacterium]
EEVRQGGPHRAGRVVARLRRAGTRAVRAGGAQRRPAPPGARGGPAAAFAALLAGLAVRRRLATDHPRRSGRSPRRGSIPPTADRRSAASARSQAPGWKSSDRPSAKRSRRL